MFINHVIVAFSITIWRVGEEAVDPIHILYFQ